MPGIEEYRNGQGYQLTWEGRKSPRARLCCIVYRSNACPLPKLLEEACFAAADLLTTPMEQVRSVLTWLTTLPDPARGETIPLPESIQVAMSRRCSSPQPGFSWCGYAWKAECPTMGSILIAQAITYPSSLVCLVELLVACWRQIAGVMEEVLSC
jgi:hypothetical protein